MEIEIIVEPLDEITFGVQSPTIGLPKGGTSGQVLAKKTDADYDTDWVSVEAAAIPDNSITKPKLVLSVRQSLDKADTSVQQVAGKGLSTNDYTNAEKSKLAGIAANANNYVHPNHSGDVVSAGDGATTIQPNVVTFAKFQEIGSQKLVGRSSAGNGDAGQIGLGGGLEFQGSNVRREALTGAVTAGAGSNTTALGSFTKAQLDTAVSDSTLLAETVADTGTAIDFTASKVFNSPASPATGNVTVNLTGAKIGIVQKLYHNDSVTPSFVAGGVLIGSGTYTLSTLNIIYLEWVSDTRYEYWITKPA